MHHTMDINSSLSLVSCYDESQTNHVQIIAFTRTQVMYGSVTTVDLALQPFYSLWISQQLISADLLGVGYDLNPSLSLPALHNKNEKHNQERTKTHIR